MKNNNIYNIKIIVKIDRLLNSKRVLDDRRQR